MLTCIACSKQLNCGSLEPQPQQQQDEDDIVETTPSRKQAIKALTSQIKDMAVKASGAYKNCKPCAGGRNGNRDFADFDVRSISGRLKNCPYRRTASSNSIRKDSDGRFIKQGPSSGEGTPVSLSGRIESVVFLEDDEPKEWVAQVEPGVLITLVSMPLGGNDLKRIRFSRELFNKWQAQRWWAENYDKVMELYNVQKFNQDSVPPPTAPPSEEEISKLEPNSASPATPPLTKETLPQNVQRVKEMVYSSSDSLDHHRLTRGPTYYNDSCFGPTTTPKLSNLSMAKTEASSMDASARSSLSRDVDHSGELSMSNASDVESEWVEQDQPGVYITMRAFPDGTRELRRVRFSRERFGEMHARLWWEENKARIQEQYL